MGKSKATFEAWVKDLKETRIKTPEEQQALDLLLSNEGVRDEVLGGFMRDKDYYTRLNEFNSTKRQQDEDAAALEEEKEKLAAWYEEVNAKHEAALKELESLKSSSEGGQTVANDPRTANLSATEKAELEQLRKALEVQNQKVETLDRGVTKLTGDMFKIMADSMKNNYDIDPTALLDYSIQNGYDLQTAYEIATREERTKRFAENREKELKAAREEGYKQARQEVGSVDRAPRSGPSTVDAFGSTPKDLSNDRTRREVGLKEFANLLA